MRAITAFIGRSFAQGDQIKIQPLLAQLDVFAPLGFTYRSAEPAEAEQVSVKVRRIIDDCDVFVGIFTKRHPVFEPGIRLLDRLNFALRPTAKIWTPPAWVVQEFGYALKGKKELILFVEPEVEMPALQGDYEYIVYDYTNPNDAFRRASETINRLIADGAGLVVETVVREQAAENPVGMEAADTASDVEKPPSANKDLVTFYFEMVDAFAKKDLAKGRAAHHSGTALLEGSKISPAWWESCFLFESYRAGVADALPKLEQLTVDIPGDPEPFGFLGDALAVFGEYERAASMQQRAAELSSGEASASYALAAAKSLMAVGKSDKVATLLIDSIKRFRPDIASGLFEKLYEVMRLRSDTQMYALAVAEYALQ